MEPVTLLVIVIDAREPLVRGQHGYFRSSHYPTSNTVASLLTGFERPDRENAVVRAAARRVARSSRRVDRACGPAGG
jgi:hypothetical protein